MRITKVPPPGVIPPERCNNFEACGSRCGFPLSISVSSRTSRKCAGGRAFFEKGGAYSTPFTGEHVRNTVYLGRSGRLISGTLWTC
jgi:hypothetical protein